MRIDRIELYHVAMPLIYPWRTAYGEDADVHSVLCCLHSGSNSAWGESSPLAAPCYSPEYAAGVFDVCRRWFGPALLNQELESGAELQRRLRFYKGNSFGKAVFDTAWWSLQSQIENTPLHRLLGGTRSSVPVGADFGVHCVQRFLVLVIDVVAVDLAVDDRLRFARAVREDVQFGGT